MYDYSIKGALELHLKNLPQDQQTQAFIKLLEMTQRYTDILDSESHKLVSAILDQPWVDRDQMTHQIIAQMPPSLLRNYLQANQFMRDIKKIPNDEKKNCSITKFLR